jgi:hypothetical protein
MKTQKKMCRMGRIRELLRQYPWGLKSSEVAEMLHVEKQNRSNVSTTLTNMPDVYIDRWEYDERGQPIPVYALAEIPEDCPRPSTKSRLPVANQTQQSTQ